MEETIVAYITTARLWRDESAELRKRHKKKMAYGLRAHFRDEIVSAQSWVRSTNPVEGQMLALDCLLSSIMDNDLTPRIEIILRTEFLRQRLDMVAARELKRQVGRTTRPMKDEAQWREVNKRWTYLTAQGGGGMRLAMSQSEIDELILVEKSLMNAFHDAPSPFDGNEPSEPRLMLPT